MATNCIIDDYVLRNRSSLLFNDQNFLPLLQMWDKADDQLLTLGHIPLFDSKIAFAHLDPIHFKLLITDVLNKRDKEIGNGPVFNESLPVVKRLYMLLMGLIYCMQVRTGAAVDNMRVSRISDIEVTFEFTITMISEKKKDPPPKSGLQVIVDNTK